MRFPPSLTLPPLGFLNYLSGKPFPKIPLSWLGLGFRPALLLLTILCPLEMDGASVSLKSQALSIRPEIRSVGFLEIPPETSGLKFTNIVSEASVAVNRILENGSGVALGDVDNDGLCDVYLCGLESDNQLFRNLGQGRFENITSQAGVACPNQASTGCALADVDNDGDLDLLVNGIGVGTRLFLNQGAAMRFTESQNSGLLKAGGAHSLALADIDNDGDLDLYVTFYRATSWQDQPPGETRTVQIINGIPKVEPADRFEAILDSTGKGVTLIELGEPDVLYLNNGKGQFSPVPWNSGRFLNSEGSPLTAPLREWGLSAQFMDINLDGAPDLYVCNDFFHSRDRFWINQGDGTFRLLPGSAMRTLSESSMAVDVTDLNRDGFPDFFVADMLSQSHLIRHTRFENAWKSIISPPLQDPAFAPETPRNTLFLNHGNTTFAEIASFAGVDASDWTWNAAFLDVDLDGYEDLLIANGYGRDMLHSDRLRQPSTLTSRSTLQERLNQSRRFSPFPSQNLSFRNQHNLTFQDTSQAWNFHDVGITQGLALGDLDQDGDLDLVLNHYNQPATVHLNTTSAPRIQVHLLTPSGSPAVGARATLELTGLKQTQELQSGGRYLSSDEPSLQFAWPTADQTGQLRIHWRNGTVTEHHGILPHHRYTIQHPPPSSLSEPTPEHRTFQPEPQRWFSDVSERIGNWVDTTQPFDDHLHQSLIPTKIGRPGPALAWFDLNQDGVDELLVGAGSGGQFASFRNNGQGGFDPAQTTTIPRDQSAVLGCFLLPNQPTVLAGFSSYATPLPALSQAPSVSAYYLLQNLLSPLIRETEFSLGAVALGDYDTDGDLDLAVAYRVKPQHYPEGGGIQLYKNQKGQFQIDETMPETLKHLGMVTSVMFSDMNGDGYPDLVAATEWGPLHLFGNDKGTFHPLTDALGLGTYTGLWNAVTTADLNGDGRLDLIATNRGTNHPQARFARHHPLRLYFLEGNGDGRLDLLESYWNEDMKRWVPFLNRTALSPSIPSILGQFFSDESFAEASMEEIFQSLPGPQEFKEVNTLESMVFLNLPNAYKPIPLPAEAQWAPAYGVTTADFNGDGNLDLFLAQNAMGIGAPPQRNDAGWGCVLKGNGDGTFQTVSPLKSGIYLLGEQRACAVSDFDRDGRPDLVVSQPQGPVKLFRNLFTHPATRIVLRGPPGNRNAAGTHIALVMKDGSRSALQEIRIGSGYLSQDSSIANLYAPGEPQKIWVRWPRGKEMEIDIPKDKRDFELNGLGQLKSF